jgi:hypothetical protein
MPGQERRVAYGRVTCYNVLDAIHSYPIQETAARAVGRHNNKEPL